MTFSRRQFILSACALTCVPFAAQAKTGSTHALYGLIGTIITGKDNAVLPDHALLIQGDVVQDILPARSLPHGILTTDTGGWILPGIINAHVHRTYTPQERTERFLRHGVTSIGDVGSPLSALKALAKQGTSATATANFSGPMLCAPGGYPTLEHGAEYGIEVDTPADARDTVRQLADHGATMIKIAFEPGPTQDPWPMLDESTAHAICDQARKLGMVVRCHVENVAGLRPALNAGVHTVEHVPYYWQEKANSRPILDDSGDTPLPLAPYRELLDKMIRDHIIMTPTLDVLSRSLLNRPQLIGVTRYFFEKGGKIALGNDYPYRRTDAGMPLREMQLLRQSGLDFLDIIKTGTAISAEACGDNKRGFLQNGMQADIIVTLENPLADIEALASPALVIKGGIPLSTL